MRVLLITDWPSPDGGVETYLSTLRTGLERAGDVRHGSVKRVASAVGEGSVVIQDVHNLFVDEALHSGSRPRRSSLGAESRSGSVR